LTDFKDMAFLLTFLGKGGVGRTTVAIAAAQRLASQGKRVLLVSQDASPALGLMLGTTIGPDPTKIGENLEVVQLHSTVLLERAWEELKTLEARYLRTPFFKNVYGQELGLLPGMDSALALNAIRAWDSQYDTIVYDSPSSPEILRMLGMPEIVSWYVRRFRQVFIDSDLGKTLSPFIPPVAAAVLNINLAADNFAQPTNEMNGLLNQGIQKLSDPNQTIAYLVTTGDKVSIATAQYLWGSAQQVGLNVGGVLVNPGSNPGLNLGETFNPLTVTNLAQAAEDFGPIAASLPDFTLGSHAPRPVTIDKAARTVSLFLPSFDKKQVKLTQYGPEITIEAGDQRRNVFLPAGLSGLPVAGAKFQDGFLIISF
jgi:anion-transporting  ArsA/GET3 family ATPase